MRARPSCAAPSCCWPRSAHPPLLRWLACCSGTSRALSWRARPTPHLKSTSASLWQRVRPAAALPLHCCRCSGGKRRIGPLPPAALLGPACTGCRVGDALRLLLLPLRCRPPHRSARCGFGIMACLLGRGARCATPLPPCIPCRKAVHPCLVRTKRRHELWRDPRGAQPRRRGRHCEARPQRLPCALGAGGQGKGLGGGSVLFPSDLSCCPRAVHGKLCRN